MHNKTIIFAPHSDDETLGCGGTIAKKVSEGNEILVVVMTDGRKCFNGLINNSSSLPIQQLIETRREETRNALKKLGISNPDKSLIFLGFEDRKLADFESAAETRVVQILSDNLPSEIFFPHSKEVNPDHRATNRIVRLAVKGLSTNADCYQYRVTQKSFSRFGPFINSVFNFLSHRKVAIDISDFLNLKKAAIKEYKSQTKLWIANQKKPVMDKKTIEAHLKNKEIFYRC